MRSRPRRLRTLLAAILLSLAALGASAQLVEPGRRLFRTTTTRFDIYYPQELAAEAARLSSFADAIYAELAPRFPGGASGRRRIPVLLADGYSSINGSFSPYPSNRIVLLAASPRLMSDLGSFDDDLRAVFSHELAHALSLGTRSPFWSFWAAILGDSVEPCLWTAPGSLIEGAAVASEGGAGTGRAKDPLAVSLVKQDILEGKYKDFWQATGAWDAYPFGRLPYNYGGLFSSYLIEEYGHERYAELWQRLGEGNIFAGIGGCLFLKGAFEATYGKPLAEAWEEFRDSVAIREPVIMEPRRLAPRPGYITALAAGSSGLYWADASQGAVLRLAPGERVPRRLFAADGSVERLDISRDGARLLVSFSRSEGDKSSRVALVRDAATGRALGPELPGLSEAAFAGDAIVGITNHGYETDLVLEREGERRVLLAGGPTRSYASPASLDGATVYCLAKDSGRVLVVRVDAVTGRAWALAPGLPLEHLRSLALGVEGGRARLALCFASEGGLYRLALVRDLGGSDATVERQETLLSGSVLMPSVADKIYYVGRFSEGEYPCSYPEDNPFLALREAGASWAALDPSFLEPERAPGRDDSISSNAQSAILPLLFRVLRVPSIPLDGDSAGIAVVGADIAERLSWSLDARYNWEVEGAELALSVSLGLRPWSLAASLSDSFSSSGGEQKRSSSASLFLGRAWSFVPSRRRIALTLDAAAAATAPAAEGEAYASPYESAGAAAGALLRFSSYRSAYSPPFSTIGAGADIALDAEWRLAPSGDARPAFSLEAGADGSLATLGLSCDLRAAASPDGSVAFGPALRELEHGGDSILSPRYGSYYEYSALPARGDFYASGEVSLNPANFELQKRLSLGRLLSPLYLNRLGIYGGARAAIYGASMRDGLSGAEILSSAFGRIALTGAPLVGTASDIHVTLGAELSWAFREDLVDSPLRIAFLAGLSL
jgi:hypothetical protein